MSNGSGDEFDIVFSPAGAYIRGFDHESPMSPYVDDEPWPGVVDQILRLNPQASIADLVSAADLIGYPIGDGLLSEAF